MIGVISQSVIKMRSNILQLVCSVPTASTSTPSLHLEVVFEDVRGCAEVQHAIDHQLAVSRQQVALVLEGGHHPFLLLLLIPYTRHGGDAT